jgi:hypothetical protein
LCTFGHAGRPEKISDELQKIIDVRTEPWGINVIAVEVKDVLIPSALEDAMSMQAQAERERQARVILGIVIVPSTAIETMQLGGLAGITALTATLGQERGASAPGLWSGSTPAKP